MSNSKNEKSITKIFAQYHLVCRRFEFGAAIFIAWGGSLLDVLGGAMLAASCPRKKHVSKYPSMASSRSGPPSSTKEYVWERHLQFGTKKSPSTDPSHFFTTPVRSKTEGVWEVVNYWNRTLSFCSGRPLITPWLSCSTLNYKWCLTPRPHIPQLFTSDLHKSIIIGSPDLMDKPLGCNLLNCNLNGGP